MLPFDKRNNTFELSSSRKSRLKSFWGNYNLSIVLALLFLTTWLLQTLSGWVKFTAEQEQHGQIAHVFGDTGYVWTWLSSTMENWESEFLQLLTFVGLTSFLIHRGSPESKDGDDEIKATLSRIETKLDDFQTPNESPYSERTRRSATT